MIRPITVVCGVLALGSGLYLYYAKHDVEVMDKRIDQIARETNAIRADSRHLLDEWIGLGQPDQLRKYSDQYLDLKAAGPAQFVRLSDLADRLPPPRAAGAEDQMEASARQISGTDGDTAQDDAEDMPVPPIPPTSVTEAALPGPAPVRLEPTAPKPRLADDPRPTPPKPVAMKPPAPTQGPVTPAVQAPALAQAPAAAKPGDPRTAEASRDIRPEPPRQQAQALGPQALGPQAAPVRQPMQQGSLLGASHGTAPLPLPAPTPVSATWPGR